MKRLRLFLTTALLLVTWTMSFAHEGMWIPMLLERYGDMKAGGLTLSQEDIYSINQDCLKDAIVIFDYGCTGELVSGQGLLLTNHHCGFDAIQKHSSVEHDYLTDGFWAFSREEELPNPGMTVTFLRYIEDVTDRVLDRAKDEVSEEMRAKIIQSNIKALEEKVAGSNGYQVVIEPLFYGLSYLMFVYEDYRDVRLVGAPPSSIGNFGEDNDNWIWPRHTGDFSIFRIYADKENKPADYNSGNIPYTPRKFLPVSTKGVEEGDFTMVMGYPGHTDQFLVSDAVRIMLDISLPQKIKLRTRRLDIMSKYMESSDTVRIQYAAKYRGVSNSWKKWQGVLLGLDRINAIGTKEREEQEFMTWATGDESRKEKYAGILPELESVYQSLSGLQLVMDYMREAVSAPELPVFADRVALAMKKGKDAEAIRAMGDDFYKDFYLPVDKETYAAMLKYYHDDIDPRFYPSFYSKLDDFSDAGMAVYAEKVYKKSRFCTRTGFNSLLALYEKSPEKALKKIMAEQLFINLNEFKTVYMAEVYAAFSEENKKLEPLYRTYVEGQMEMQKDRVFYPDANFTMRVTFGAVEGYKPQDAVEYNYYTTLGGIIQKSREGKKDYLIPGKLLDLYESGDFGPYADGDRMPVCFVASNHTSGGNSGSPVLNGKGELIGINFDRNWEGTMSDVMYDPTICRNISVDIRYVLFIIDKYAGAGYLIDEMQLMP